MFISALHLKLRVIKTTWLLLCSQVLPLHILLICKKTGKNMLLYMDDILNPSIFQNEQHQLCHLWKTSSGLYLLPHVSLSARPLTRGGSWQRPTLWCRTRAVSVAAVQHFALTSHYILLPHSGPHSSPSDSKISQNSCQTGALCDICHKHYRKWNCFWKASNCCIMLQAADHKETTF